MSDTQHFLRTIAADSAALAAAARVDPQARVPSCPDWSERDLLDHVGRVHHWVAGIVGSRTQDRVPFASQAGGPDDAEGTLRWFDEGWHQVLDALQGIGEEEPVWTWFRGVAPARYWVRRMALETAVHRWDGQGGTGTPEAIDPTVGAAGLEELCVDLLPLLRQQTPRVSTEATLHLHCTDADGEWLIRFSTAGATATREHAKGDVAVRGTASDLYLMLWNRISAADSPALEIFGDASLLRRWADAIQI